MKSFVFARIKLSAPWHKVATQGDSLSLTAECGYPTKSWMYLSSADRPTGGRVCQNCESL